MEPVQGSTSGHMQLDIMLTHPLVHALAVEYLPLLLWALTTTVKQDITLFYGSLFSTLMTHCGMDKIAVDLSVHAVILQTFRGSARTFLSQLLMTWSFASVGMNLAPMKMFPLILSNSTYSDM